MSSENDMTQGFSTLAIHTKLAHERYDASLGLCPAIFPASTYKVPPSYVLNDPGTYVYGRYGNPSRDGAEAVIAKMEGAKHTMLFSSGMSSTNAVIEALLESGDHVVASRMLYGGSVDLFRDWLPKIGMSRTFTNDLNADSVQGALTEKTKLVWLEICTNPLITVTNIKNVVGAIRAFNKDIIIGMDNTFLSPYLVKPLEYDLDIVMHSATKYLGGHSDLLMGVLSTNRDDIFKKIKLVQQYRGAIPSPFDCFLLHRSLSTLEVRMDKHFTNALNLAKFLEAHPLVEKVLHPILESHPDHQLAMDQFRGKHSGIFSFYVKGSKQQTEKFIGSLKMITSAVSLGGIHSNVCLPRKTSHSFLSPDECQAINITDNMVRISVGLEDVKDLKEDLNQALQKAVRDGE